MRALVVYDRKEANYTVSDLNAGRVPEILILADWLCGLTVITTSQEAFELVYSTHEWDNYLDTGWCVRFFFPILTERELVTLLKGVEIVERRPRKAQFLAERHIEK